MNVSTKGKICLYGLQIQTLEIPTNESIFICGDWCTKYIKEYECCIDVLHKYHAVKVMQEDLL